MKYETHYLYVALCLNYFDMLAAMECSSDVNFGCRRRSSEIVKSTNFSIIWNISSTDTELFLLFTFVIATWSWWLARVSVSVTQFSRQTNLRQNKLGKEVVNFEFWRSKLKRKFVKLSGVKTQEVLWKYKTKERIKSSSKHRMITQTLSNCPKKIA